MPVYFFNYFFKLTIHDLCKFVRYSNKFNTPETLLNIKKSPVLQRQAQKLTALNSKDERHLRENWNALIHQDNVRFENTWANVALFS